MKSKSRIRSAAMVVFLVLIVFVVGAQSNADVTCNVGGGGEIECHVRSAEGDFYCVVVGWWHGIPIFQCVDLN